ncbi:hypothetical protein BN7_3053 [Wickerhamomyces ciferrii]|uniref:DNA polymerase delta subunit 3 n=1 Tax=Wickerhamomyces ciferrii (strain ATCC 14091 / BCRC 22168 / CBS 111 / JCM 3599 / NBRC 0793 / NRRL Y-1031 F-60-10) TaxID=1206466 RepID=K0KQG8_WICCF|nr:uncharacterized protein BN7_3053 [Wickerhamomyces ciferrii]CCH43503.1 hypothetical protein BN7_3053 [Wickerhamomyces ciferrii]
MGVFEDAIEVLKNALVKENKPYTYKLLSRHLNIHVNDSKKLLYSFHQKYQDLVDAHYLISGRLNNSTDLTIKITKDINEKDKFDQIQSIQIYSLSPKNIEINEILSTANAQIREIPVDAEKLAKWGVIKGPELVKIDQLSTSSNTNTSSRSNTNTSSRLPIGGDNKEQDQPTKKKNDFPDMGLRSAQILNRNKKKDDDKPRARTATQPTFGSSMKKSNTKQTSLQQQPLRSRTDPTPKSSGSGSKPIEIDDEETIQKKKITQQEKDKKQKELESMFDDDDDDDDFEASQSSKKDDAKPEKEETSIEEIKDDKDDIQEVKNSKNDDLEGIFDSSFTQSQSQQEPQQKEQTKDDTQKIEDEPEPILETTKDQPIQEEPETTSYYDEDGYLVTEVKEKPKPKTQSKPKPKARTATPPASNNQPASKKAKIGKTGGKQQTSLMSFFGKK